LTWCSCTACRNQTRVYTGTHFPGINTTSLQRRGRTDWTSAWRIDAQHALPTYGRVSITRFAVKSLILSCSWNQGTKLFIPLRHFSLHVGIQKRSKLPVATVCCFTNINPFRTMGYYRKCWNLIRVILIGSAKNNGLEPYQYLRHVFKELP